MALETATYINQLVSSNPTADDALSDGQKHLNLIKTVLKATFPNFVGPVTASNTDLSTGLATNIAALQADYVSKTRPTAQTVVSNVSVTGQLSGGTIMQGGAVLIPPGVIVMWHGAISAIPLGWALCDGTNSTPDLRNRFVVGAGSTYAPAATGGAASSTATSSSAGVHTHTGSTGTTGPFALTGSADTQGVHSHGGSTNAHQLLTTEMPSHAHATFATPIGVAGGGTVVNVFGGSGAVATTNIGGDGVHSHPISPDGAHSHNISVSNSPAHLHAISSDGAHTHTVTTPTLPPYYALAFIMKTAGAPGGSTEWNSGSTYDNGGSLFG